jgi:hypothetical protein
MRHLALSVALAFSAAFLLVAPVSAQTTPDAAQPGQSASDAAPPQSQSGSTQTAIEGPALGQHVSGHAPEHPLEQGRLFGDCVSELATTGKCPHDDVDGLDG